MTAAFSAVAFVALSTACSAERPKSVEEVVTNIHGLNGETVTVAGYLADCAGYDCNLYVDEAHAKQAEAWIRRLRAARGRDGIPPGRPFDAALGIGSGRDFEFDHEAAPFQHSYALITGKVTDRCRDENGEIACLDRSTDLEPISIRAWNRLEGADG
jgi:hypothetical protein